MESRAAGSFCKSFCKNEEIFSSQSPNPRLFCFITQTLALSYMCGTISRFVFGYLPSHKMMQVLNISFCSTTACLFHSYYETKAVFLAMGITVVVCVSVTIFCFQTKVEGDVVCVCSSAACGLSENVFVVSVKERFCLTLQWATEFL